jgi:DNA-binding NarL/FixJ family response regulator
MTINVLLADDHTVLRDALRVLLDQEGDIKVVADSGDGQEAIRLATELKPDVAIVDIMMPGITGIEAASKIIARSPETALIILSMHATHQHVFHALQAGCLGYVLKESGSSELVEAVRAVSTGQRFLSAGITDMVVDEYLRSTEDPEHRSPSEMLSARELEVVRLVVDGKTSAEIGELLHLSPKTIDTYRQRAMQKLGINDLASLVKFAIKHSLTD